jgi:putative ABC transport system permease protein
MDMQTRLYRVMLWLLPPEVRDRHGEQMAEVFAQSLRDARRRGGRRLAVRTACAELRDLVWFAWEERRGDARRQRLRRFDERQFAWPSESSISISIMPASPTSTPGSGRKPLMIGSLLQDIRYGFRMLLRAPGFSLVCVLTMALAIGANTAIFSAVNGVLLQPLRYHDPERLVVIGHRPDDGIGLNSTTPGNFYDWQRDATGFEAMAAWGGVERNLSNASSAERVPGVISAGSLFDVLGRRALIGRTFTADDDGPGKPPVIVLSHGLWQRLYGDDRTAIGKTLTLGATAYTVIGVMPPDFAFPGADAQFWTPATFDQALRGNRFEFFLLAAARLKPGVSAEQAQAQLDAVMDRIRLQFPRETQNARAGVMPMQALLVDGVRTRLFTLMGAVACVLLIACANLGNLLLARAASRRREIALRQALGARPARIFRQLLTESLILAILGGALGIALGAGLLTSLLALLPENLPRASEVRLDATVLAVTLLAALGSGVVFGIFPAIHLARRSSGEALREGTRGTSRGRRVHTGLVVAEVALAIVLLTGAGLLVRSFSKLVDVDPGFKAEKLLTFRVGLAFASYPKPEQRVAFFEELRRKLRALPGVDGVAMTTTLPVAGRGTGAWFNILDRPLPPNQTPPAEPYRIVSDDTLQVLGIPLVRGRYFTASDGRDGSRAVIISESVERRYWPGGDALGKRIYLGAPDSRVVDDAMIVGIVKDVKQQGLDESSPTAVYIPHPETTFVPTFSFALRSSIDPASLTSAARAAIREVDPSVPMFRVRTIDDVLSQSTQPARSSMVLLSGFAGVALLLAVLGVFSVLSYGVAQRAKEFGIRMSLGAGSREVVLLVLRQGLIPVAAGIALGLAGAFGLTRFMQTLLFGVTATDPLTFAAVGTGLAGVAAIACYLPARRATRVDPVVVLRND